MELHVAVKPRSQAGHARRIARTIKCTAEARRLLTRGGSEHPDHSIWRVAAGHPTHWLAGQARRLGGPLQNALQARRVAQFTLKILQVLHGRKMQGFQLIQSVRLEVCSEGGVQHGPALAAGL